MQRDSENTAGMAVRLEMTYDPATRRASPGTLEIVPLYIARQREDSGIVYRVVDAENEQAIQSLTTTEQAAAAQAVERVKNADTGGMSMNLQKNFGLRHPRRLSADRAAG